MQLHTHLHSAIGAGLALWLAAGVCGISAASQPGSTAAGIYSCIDGKGRRITADRPIAECMDRTQKQLSGSGMVRREIAPSMTADERVAFEEKEKAANEQKWREAEEKKRDRALQVRYPSRAEHDKERRAALSRIDDIIKTSGKRAQELAEQRKAITNELEFYKATPGRVPPVLSRRLEENDSSLAEQKRFVAEQDDEKKRVNQRFDDEMVKLTPFWGRAGAPPDKTVKR